jgi:recombination protein RecA
MASLALIRAQVERRLPGALTTYTRAEREMLLTGIPAIDEETGGIPKSALTQICAPVGNSSGKTTLLLSLMAQATRRGEFTALIDAGDCFDPVSADAAGVELSHVLWVRCGERPGMRLLEQAFKAADILVQNGGFGLIAVDLGNSEDRLIRKIPLTTWFRFARVIEKLPAALVFLSSSPAARSCASLTLQLDGGSACWQEEGALAHTQLLTGVNFTVEIVRSSTRKPVQSVRPKFTGRSQWA